jgi:hypothetical protein
LPLGRPVKDDAERLAGGLAGGLADGAGDGGADLPGQPLQRGVQARDLAGHEPAGAAEGRC